MCLKCFLLSTLKWGDRCIGKSEWMVMHPYNPTFEGREADVRSFLASQPSQDDM